MYLTILCRLTAFMMSKLVKFQEIWLKSSEFQNWIQPIKEKPNYARCILCFCDIFLSNMGRQAVSHMKSKKHIDRYKSMKLKDFLVATADSSVLAISSNSFSSSSAQTLNLLLDLRLRIILRLRPVLISPYLIN